MRYCLSCAAVIALAACQTREPVTPADLILHAAVVYTVDAARPKAEAVAIRGDRLVLVGSNDEALALRGPATRVIDLRGATIVPGIEDAHGHFTGLGESLIDLNLRGTTSYGQIVEMVRQRAASARPGEWIRGRSWDQNDWPGGDWPTHQKLSEVAPGNPVYLTRVDSHAALVNKAALDAAGVTRATKDPDGGRLIRDARGEPTGVLIDTAQRLVAARIPPPSNEQLEDQILRADSEARRLGITMVHDAGTTPAVVEIYKRLIDQSRLKTRLYVMLRGPMEMLEPELKKGPIVNYGNHHLAVRAIKIGADGALGSRGAALIEPYSDEPTTSGLMTTPPDEIYRQTLAASRAGFQTCIHAIGDRGNRVTMDVFERVQSEVPGARDLRMRNEHAQILDAAEIPRFATLNVIASMQATHATSDMPWVPARIGDERTAEGAYVWKRLLDSGVTLANGSDFPVEEANPMLGIYAAVTRQDPKGEPANGWMPAERLNREEALKSFTWSAAYAAHAENDLGSLEAGKLADLVVLDRDIMTVDPKAIPDAVVRFTVIGGEIVYERK